MNILTKWKEKYMVCYFNVIKWNEMKKEVNWNGSWNYINDIQKYLMVSSFFCRPKNWHKLYTSMTDFVYFWKVNIKLCSVFGKVESIIVEETDTDRNIKQKWYEKRKTHRHRRVQSLVFQNPSKTFKENQLESCIFISFEHQ